MLFSVISVFAIALDLYNGCLFAVVTSFFLVFNMQFEKSVFFMISCLNLTSLFVLFVFLICSAKNQCFKTIGSFTIDSSTSTSTTNKKKTPLYSPNSSLLI
jgi:hypothetical protein